MVAHVLVQEFIAAKSGSTHSQQNLGSAQLQSAERVANLSPGGSSASASDRRQAASVRAEELHEQQALLNQLKEVPVKGMNASLLVAPLLDHGEDATHSEAGVIEVHI